jgi:putative intracellular protease/amidase
MGSEDKAVLFIPQRDFQEDEFEGLKSAMDSAGIMVTVVSTVTGECYGIDGGMVEAEMALYDVNPSDYSAVIFIGGPGVETLYSDIDVLAFVKRFYGEERVVGAIGTAPAILARAGILHNKKATAWDGVKEDVVKIGRAIFTNEFITVDGNIITADSSEAAEELGGRVAEMLIG